MGDVADDYQIISGKGYEIDSDLPLTMGSNSPSHTELRDKLINLVHDIAEQDYVGVTPAQASVFADRITELFQAREQQLLTELLGEAVTIAQDKMYDVVISEDGTSEKRLGKEFIHAVPVLVIERLQNKTNDGGSDGASE